MGRLLPAGTGISHYRSRGIKVVEEVLGVDAPEESVVKEVMEEGSPLSIAQLVEEERLGINK